MAYKNQKKNKQRVKELKKDPWGWRKKARHRREQHKKEMTIKSLKEHGWPEEAIRRILG